MNRIAQLNDSMRKASSQAELGHNRIVMTRGVVSKGVEFQMLALEKVRNFDTFTEDNDPHGEHDFGMFDMNGARLMWKIDYYDPSLSCGSDDPANPEATVRVLTILLAEEY